MQTVIFNYQPSLLRREAHAIALRIAYLFADSVISAGTTMGEVFIRSILKNVPLVRKIKMMGSFFTEDPALGSFAQAEHLFRQAETVKRKDKEFIVAHKKLEKRMMENWDFMMTKLEEISAGQGFGMLRELTDKVIGYLPVDANPEWGDDTFIAVSKLFRRQFEEGQVSDAKDGGESLFMVESGFLSSGYLHPALYAPASPEATGVANCYLHHCFTLPYIGKLSTPELQSVRNNLHHEGNGFRSSTNAWATACYSGNDNDSTVASFLQTVVPQSAFLQQVIAADITLQQCRQAYAQYPTYEVWMGEMPVPELWNYYRHKEAFGNETWAILEEAKNNPEFSARRWPVIMVKEIGELPAEESETGAVYDDILPVRKFIAVD